MDFFNQGIPLGRWFGIRVLIHWTFLLYAASRLFGDQNIDGAHLAIKAMYLTLLFGTVLLHEFGHALSCRAMGGDAHQIILWPLGGIAFVQPPMNPTAWLVTTVCGPLVNAILWPIFWYLSVHWIPDHFPLGLPSVSWQYIDNGCYIMWQINRMLLLFNLIPAYPMDGGRILQEVLWFIIGYGRSMKVAGMVGTVAGVGFVVIGLGVQSISIPQLEFELGEKGVVDPMLCVIGAMCAMASFSIYKRSEEMKTWRKN